MFSTNLIVFIFILYFSKTSSQTPNMSLCYPIPIGINYSLIPSIQLPIGCQNLLPYTNELNLTCCEIDFQEKENSSALRMHGCMAFLKNYIDNDRYEDIIDWIERGKGDKFENYSVFLGKTAYYNFKGFIKNEKKYTLYKLDCFMKFISLKYALFGLLLLFSII